MSTSHLVQISMPLQGNGAKSRQDWLETWVGELKAWPDFLGLSEGSATAEVLTLDPGEAPRDRDWVGQKSLSQVEFYFSSQRAAKDWSSKVSLDCGDTFEIELRTLEPQDWNANWRASYQGVFVEPHWEIRPIWNDGLDQAMGMKRILMNPSLGFGTGEHPTTQLCLQALSRNAELISGAKMLDFGSGSGILAVAGLQLNASSVLAVEIDEMARKSAEDCFSLNGVSDRVQLASQLNDQKFRLIVANILRETLEKFSGDLISALETKGVLILSGLLAADVAPIGELYRDSFKKIHGFVPEERVFAAGEWRAIEFHLERSRSVLLSPQYSSRGFMLGERFVSPIEVIAKLEPMITDQRARRLRQMLSERCLGLPIVLEDIHNQGNIAAVLRTAEGLGFQSVQIIEDPNGTKISTRTTQGAEKWLSIRKWSDSPSCFHFLKSLGYRIATADLESTETIDDIDWSIPTAIVLGNEVSGVGLQTKTEADLRFRIPMRGLSQSFNISVAAALIMFTASQQRSRSTLGHGDLEQDEQDYLLAQFLLESVRGSDLLFS